MDVRGGCGCRATATLVSEGSSAAWPRPRRRAPRADRPSTTSAARRAGRRPCAALPQAPAGLRSSARQPMPTGFSAPSNLLRAASSCGKPLKSASAAVRTRSGRNAASATSRPRRRECRERSRRDRTTPAARRTRNTWHARRACRARSAGAPRARSTSVFCPPCVLKHDQLAHARARDAAADVGPHIEQRRSRESTTCPQSSCARGSSRRSARAARAEWRPAHRSSVARTSASLMSASVDERQMRAVLLDGRDGQQRDRSLSVDTAEIGRREVLPIAAAQRRKRLVLSRREPSCRVAGSRVNLG